MRPISLTLCGIGPHENTTIDFATLGSPVAICAPYGTGKTWLIEGIIGSLYGQFAWYSGSIYDALTQGGTGEGSLALTFEHGGEHYYIRRELRNTGKTRSQRAELYRVETQIENELIAGPKVQDVQRVIDELIGDIDTTLATWFLSQNRRGDLCGQPGEADLVARRRAVFNELIGAARLDKIEQVAAERSRKLAAIAEELTAQLAGEPDYLSEIKQADSAARIAAIDLEETRDRLTIAEAELEQAQAALRDAQGGESELKANIERHEQAQREADSIQRRRDDLKSEIARLDAEAGNLDAILADCKQLDDVTALRGRLETQAEKHAEHERWKNALDLIERDLSGKRALVESLKNTEGVDDETRAMAALVDTLQAKLIETRERNEMAEQMNKKHDGDRAGLEQTVFALRDHLKRMNEDRDTRPAVLFGDDCDACPLMVRWTGLDEAIERCTAKIADNQAKIDSLPEPLPIVDLSEITADLARAQAAQRSVDAAAAARARLETENANLAKIEHDRITHLSAEPESADDPGDELKRARAEAERLASAPARLETCKRAAERAIDKRAELGIEETTWRNAQAAADGLRNAANDARAALTNREAARVELEARKIECADNVNRIRSDVERLAGELARAETRKQDLADRWQASEDKRTRERNLRAEIAALSDVRAAFGPRGARQILIDAAAPDLEAIAANLFDKATGGRMRLRIATQTVNQDGSIREDFQILVTDQRGERDALRYSGGQLQLIQILFRISVALWVGKLRGRRPDCLFLDEAFDRLGADGTDDLIRALDSLGDEIQTIAVVTHDPQIAARLGSCIHLDRGAAGVSVEVA